MKTDFLKLIKSQIIVIQNHKELATFADVDKEIILLHDKIIEYCNDLKDLVDKSSLSINYTNQLSNDIDLLIGNLPYSHWTKPFNNNNLLQIKRGIESNRQGIELQLKAVLFNLEFFKKLDFFNNNIVAIGANGSGKSSLSGKLKNYLQNNGVVISAQRILLVPVFDSLSNPSRTAVDLKNSQIQNKTNRSQDEFNNLQKEFGIVLRNLLADNVTTGNLFRIKALEQIKEGIPISEPTTTNLDKTLAIWNSLIEHRKINCADGINITISTNDSSSYSPSHMSDGEKVMLFLIAQVLQAPRSGFIIIDEPEIYLHKTILKKLWDILERERHDCIFIYLTHDLEFAVSRLTSKKIWIKSFTHPDKWDIETIPENEMPESLLLELIGSRKNILFCEGEKGKIDDKVYNILFPNYTITPVGNCSSVINYTKAFNKLGGIVKAFGIIDSDHHDSKRLDVLQKENIFSFSMAEPENLFLDEDFLFLLADQLLIERTVIERIKEEVLNELEKEIELQISNYISAKINYYFKESHVSKGNTLNDLEINYSKFTNEIKINDWFSERKSTLKDIIEQKNYHRAISVFNNKGLKRIVNKNFNITDFSERAIKMLQNQPSSHTILKRHFPADINT